MSGFTLDAGALIAVERRDRKMTLLLKRTRHHGWRVTIPTTVLAQVLRSPVRQVSLMKLRRQPDTDLVALDAADANAVGLLLAATHSADIVDAHVVVCARRAGQAVVTSDPDDLARLAPELLTVRV